MIITRTPFRVSFAGGGSDVPAFYRRHEGCVVSTSINKYMYVTIHPSFEPRTTAVKYSKTEIVDDIRKIRHPVARQVLLDYNVSGVEITSTADVPSGTGLSTSSAYTVGLIHAMNAYVGKYASQEKIASKACVVELEELGEPIGKQDQYGVAVGGLKFIRFRADETVDVEPIIMTPEAHRTLNDNLLLFYTGLNHSADEILKEQTKSISSSEEKFSNLIRMTGLAYELKDALCQNRVSQLGEILHQGWLLKRSLTGSISNSFIDEYYDRAMAAGASGGKLLGAGGGGFLLFYCEKEKQARLKSELSDLKELPFELDNSGTKVIFVGDKNWD